MKKTPLYKYHEENGHLGEFAGYTMPSWYQSPTKEHMSVRSNVGIFDISHMGRLVIAGTESANLLDFLLTNNCVDLKKGKSRMSFFCNRSGGVIDDVMVTRLDTHEFLVTTNAANKDIDLRWIKEKKDDFDVEIDDLTGRVPMIAVQGPRSAETLERLFGQAVSSLVQMQSSWFSSDGNRLLVSRTGYTGEDGFEIYLFEQGEEYEALGFWKEVLRAGEEPGIQPCGLAARDTLRLEAGFCLYGNELNEDVTPIEARLDFGVRFDERIFIGRNALSSQVERGVDKLRVGLKALERGIPRKGMEIWKDNKEIGLTTSGTLSPILKTGIAMGYVPPEYASPGTRVSIDIRGKKVRAEVVDLPFYSREQKASH